MAKVITGPLISEIRGNCADVCFARNRGGLYARKVGVRVQPWSYRQDLYRTILQPIGLRWNANLTEDQRLAWNALAATMTKNDQLGQAAPLSGHNWWFRINAAAAIWDLAPFDDVPQTLEAHFPPFFTTITATASPPSLIIDLDRDLAGNEFFGFAATKSMNVGVYSFSRRFTYFTEIESPGSLPHDATADYLAQFPALVAGKKIALLVKSINTDNAILSGTHIATTIVQATPGTNLLLNPDFETGTPGSQAPDYTLLLNNGLIIATDFFQHGAQSAKITNASDLYSVSAQEVHGLTPGDYILQGYIKTTALTGPGIFAGIILNSLPAEATLPTVYNNHKIAGYETLAFAGIPPADTPADWTFINMRVTLPPAQTGIHVYVHNGWAAGLTGSAWFDYLWLVAA